MKMAALEFRPVKKEDYGWIYALNKACVPAMNSLEEWEIADLLQKAFLARAAFLGTDPVGAVIGFAQDSDYESENFRWFQERFENFLYIDRIMVDEHLRGKGYGSNIYTDIFNVSKDNGLTSALCEVNEIPPNPKSMKLHLDIGFTHVESRFNQSHSKQVAMLHKTL